MSRKTLRQAVAEYFTGRIPNLILLAAQDFWQQAEFTSLSGSGATGYVYIMGDEEVQEAMVGSPSYGIEVHYTVVVVVEFESSAQGPTQGSPTYMDDHDDMIQAFKTLLRADPTLGTASIQGQPGAVFSAGKGAGAQEYDVRVFSELPEQDEEQVGLVRIRTSIEFTAIERIMVAGG